MLVLPCGFTVKPHSIYGVNMYEAYAYFCIRFAGLCIKFDQVCILKLQAFFRLNSNTCLPAGIEPFCYEWLRVLNSSCVIILWLWKIVVYKFVFCANFYGKFAFLIIISLLDSFHLVKRVFFCRNNIFMYWCIWSCNWQRSCYCWYRWTFLHSQCCCIQVNHCKKFLASFRFSLWL